MKESGEYGEYFPVWFSPFGYNKTTAQLYYPLSKEEALSKGLKWDDYEPPAPKVEKVLKVDQLPDNISDITDEYLEWAIECEITGKLFRITPQELKFYRNQKLPLPRKCPDQRHLERFQKRNPRILFDRKCDKCGKEIQTTYSPERTEKVLCETCYLQEVY